MLQVAISKIPAEGLDVDEAVSGAGLGIDANELAIEPGGRFKGHVEKGDAGDLHVRGHLTLRTNAPCARCLANASVHLDQELDLFFLAESETTADSDDEEGVELKDRDLVVSFYRGDVLDIGAVIREQTLLAQPMKRLCKDDCRGVCPVCGTDRNLKACDCRPEASKESPFAALSRLGTGGRALE